MSDIVIMVFMIVASFFLLVAAIGLVRLPDYYMRLHAATKGMTVGIGCMLIASAIFFSIQRNEFEVQQVLITLFLFMTAPITVHLMAKAALHVRIKAKPGSLNEDHLEDFRDRRVKTK